MRIQSNLASTIAMAFDECPSSVADRKYMADSVARTTRWLKRCKDEMARLNSLPDTINPHQMLFGINQGGVYEDIRIEHAQQITELFRALKKVFPYIVVDMSSNIDANSLKILDSSDWILFTTIVNIPAIRNCQRCLNLFNSRRYPKDKVRVVVNRYMENDEIKIEDIENTLGEKVYWKIPNNYFTIMEAINKGVCISEINADSNIGNNFRDFASKVSDDIIEQSVIQYRA